MPSQYDAILQVGERLRSYRIGKGLSPEEVANKAGISRAAIYRYESGQPIKVDVLGRIADLLGVSLTSLFGVGSEYIDSAVTFFERMKQIEANAEQISVLFGPISYLLTTDRFDEALGDVLLESVPENAPDRDCLSAQVQQILTTLKERKAAYRQRQPTIVSLVSSAELEQFVQLGFVGCHNVDDKTLCKRREIARLEIENIIEMIAEQPMGVQIGVVEDSIPGSSFQIFRNGPKAQVAVSPFRLGTYPNVRIGVATITSAQESVALHQKMTEQLWRNSLKGQEAVARLSDILG
ncbi:XRE family transcriptional regulator [Thalassobius vesicularis]|uniref:XRE family transcriptional regulator n=2 Tax=Thalassobius vesicularis TaxID=1294297 RepID=A0A4S3MF72_9RHOB|nr:XRE family transcriptional regulator [Thalassobius vesicularis]